MKISIIIPVYNEIVTVGELLRRVNEADIGAEKEIIVVDDGSTDGSMEFIARLPSRFKTILQDRNMGRATAVRRALSMATGDYCIMQDADLEYDPQDIRRLVEKAISENLPAVFGSRLMDTKRFRSKPLSSFYLGNRGLSLFASILYGTRITDVETCYRLVRKDVLDDLHLSAKTWALEPEIFAKLRRKGIRITEVPISYTPRSASDGKKITWTAGIEAAWTLIKYRFHHRL